MLATVVLKIPRSVLEIIDSVAESHGLTRSELLRIIIYDWLRDNGWLTANTIPRTNKPRIAWSITIENTE